MNCITSTTRDLKNIVECHKSAFPDSLSTQMGTSFILKMMEWYIKSDRGVLFHLENENKEIIGYCGGIITKQQGLHGALTSISQYAFYTFLFSYIKRPWLLFHPENIKKIPYIKKNILLKMGFNKAQEKLQNNTFKPFMGLIVIGLKNKYQGKGIGSILLNEFEKIAISINGIKQIVISVKTENKNAIKAYQKNNWQIIQKDNTSIQLVKKLAY